jgi:hypothetical protein
MRGLSALRVDWHGMRCVTIGAVLKHLHLGTKFHCRRGECCVWHGHAAICLHSDLLWGPYQATLGSILFRIDSPNPRAQ